MRAADYGHEKAVESLVEAGADLKIKDNAGQGTIVNRAQYVLQFMIKKNLLYTCKKTFKNICDEVYFWHQ